MELSLHFHLTPRDVDQLWCHEFEAYVESVQRIRKEASES